MLVHEHVDARRVAAAHLEPIERRERLLDRQIGGQRALTRITTGEQQHLTRRAQPIVTHRPQRVAQGDRLDAALFELVDRKVGDLEPEIEVGHEGVELIEASDDGFDAADGGRPEPSGRAGP